MEEIRLILEEIQKEIQPELGKLERPVEDDDEREYGEEGDEEREPEEDDCDGDEEEEEENGCGGDEEEECDDDEEEDDCEEDDEGEYDAMCLPHRRHVPLPLCNTGSKYTLEEAQNMLSVVWTRNEIQFEEWCEMSRDGATPSHGGPIFVLPEVTKACVSGSKCYHRRFWTDLASPTEPNHPNFIPCEMMQVFSLRLSSTLSRPVNIYGHFALRDSWEPLRNYLFKRSRDDPATIAPGCSFLPLCSPCRGIYVLQRILLDIDLWIKEEDGSADRPLICGFAELDALLAFERKSHGRLHGNGHDLDMHFAFLLNSIESVVEIFAEARHSSKVKISALTSGYDDETALYDGIFCGTGTIARHFLAVKMLGELRILMEVDGSLYSWTYQAGVGVVKEPENAVSEFAQFTVRVSFGTKGKAASGFIKMMYG
ncbi:hypothetical protein ACP70R_037735 [Stipagrostis hirtigluma subsp. patula]